MDKQKYDLASLRNNIDSIDSKMLELFKERMENVVKVAKYKEDNGIPILNQDREAEVIRKNLGKLQNDSLEVYAEGFLMDLMQLSREYQKKIMSKDAKKIPKKIAKAEERIGFYGEEGSYTEQAMYEYFGEEIKGVASKEFEDVFEKLKNNEVVYGVVPIENSSTGAISEVYDLLNEYDFYIVGEICISINQNLLAIPGTKLEDIEEVYSHPQGFEQSRDFLKLFPNWRLIPHYSTSKSAEYVKSKASKKMAAIASKKAASVYGLNILKKGIHSIKSNTTKFAIIGIEMPESDGCDKISIVFSTEHTAGSLFSVLKNFAEHNINLHKIESRPFKGKNWEYLFYLDFEGNLKDIRIQETLELVKTNSQSLKILGNYKKFTEEI